MDTTETTVSRSTRKKVRDDGEQHDLMNRLKRIEGQVRGLQRMLEENAYCPDILTQASAVNSAINSFCRVLLTNHPVPASQKISGPVMTSLWKSWRKRCKN